MFWRDRTAFPQGYAQLVVDVGELKVMVMQLKAELHTLETHHEQLRGRFYQARRELMATPQVPQTREARRAEALRAVGARPGRPLPPEPEE